MRARRNPEQFLRTICPPSVNACCEKPRRPTPPFTCRGRSNSSATQDRNTGLSRKENSFLNGKFKPNLPRKGILMVVKITCVHVAPTRAVAGAGDPVDELKQRVTEAV